MGPPDPELEVGATARKLAECQRRVNELESLLEEQSFALAEARVALLHFRLALNHSAPTVCDYLDKDHAAALKAAWEG
jgi:hypothetical protein